MCSNLVVMWKKVRLYFVSMLAFLNSRYNSSGSSMNLLVASPSQHCTSLPPLVPLFRLNRNSSFVSPCVSVWLITIHGVWGQWHITNKVMQMYDELVLNCQYSFYTFFLWFTKCQIFLKCMWECTFIPNPYESHAVSVGSPPTNSYTCFTSYSLCLCLFSLTSASLFAVHKKRVLQPASSRLYWLQHSCTDNILNRIGSRSKNTQSNSW